MNDLRSAVEALAARWADQATDHDEDTEQQIEDGRALRALLADHPDDTPEEEARHQRALMAAGVISAAGAQWALAGTAAGPTGKAECEGIARWLEDFGTRLLNQGK